MFSITFYVFVGVALLAYYILKPKRQRSINLPGPITNYVPIFGCAVELEARFYRVFAKWSEKYGPMCRLKMGQRNVVLVGDNKIAKEMLAIDAFVGRGNVDEFTLFEGENIGLIASEGAVWEEQRRFIVRQLRDFGFGKTSMESTISEEARELVDRLAAYKGTPVEDFKNVVSLAVVNSLWSIVAGTRYSQDDPKLRELAYQMSGAFEEASKAGGIIAVMSWLKYVIPEWSGYNSIRRSMNNIIKFVNATIKEHKETYQEDGCRDFIDVYLQEINKTKDSTSSFHRTAAEKQLIAVVSDLFQAGTDTTSTTLNWAILYLIKRPEILRKMQQEITTVTGDTRPVSFSDRPNMPYTLAVISELLRISIVPFGAPHRVLQDTEFRGAFFPKNTFIFINMWYMHHDPKVWENPQDFMPERFLSADEKSYKKNDNLNPFLVGRRQCPGESLARDTVFLMLTRIVQNFDIVNDPNSPEPDDEPAVHFMITTKPYKAVFLERKK